MSWMEQLVQTYDENEHFVGKYDVQNTKSVLAPIGHMTINAQIEITLDGKGNLISASAVPKENAETLIPCTLDSASRTSKPTPHPLHDNLQYVARDYTKYAPQEKKKGKDKEPYELYKDLLGQWASSKSAHPKIKAVYNYISEHDVIHDLIAEKVLLEDENGEIMKKWAQKDVPKPTLFTVSTGDILKSVIRFRVDMKDGTPVNLWEDRAVQESYIDFFRSSLPQEKQLCYATGRTEIVTDKHPKYIRFPGDGAKLISSNDSDGYTYRGRFTTGTECATISMEASQKAMNALRWLIRNQGYRNAKKVFLAWGRSGITPPSPVADTDRVIRRARNREKSAIPQTMQAWSSELHKALDGYRHEFKKAAAAQVNLMVLDAATPGRMSICYYSEMAANDFIDRIETWHKAGAWRQHTDDKDNKKRWVYFGVPHPKRIINACYGEKAGDSQVDMALERIFQCIVNGRAVPRDMAKVAVDRVVKRSVMAVGSSYRKWHYDLLEPTCSLICNQLYYEKNGSKEGYTVALNLQNHNRSYLYGRLLAVADKTERATFSKEEREKRLTNAMKFMERFSQRPCSTWRMLHMKLLPYLHKMGKYQRYRKLLDEIGSQFSEEDFTSDQPLDGEFLLGFYCQNHDIEQRIIAAAEKKKQNQEQTGIEENEGGN